MAESDGVQSAKRMQTVAAFASSVELTVALIAFMVLLALAGAWIPQSGEVDRNELLARFGTEGLRLLEFFGLSDVYKSVPFTAAVLLLFINLAACTVLKMSPRIKSRLKKEDFKEGEEIRLLKENKTIQLECDAPKAIARLSETMRRLGYTSAARGRAIIFEKGKIGWLAAPVTHLGLFVLLAGALITAAFSYSGTIFLRAGQEQEIASQITRRPLLGSPQKLAVTLKSTKKESYKTGEPKQWTSIISVADKSGNKSSGTISVNHPWSLNGVDFYQSDWRVAGVKLGIKGETIEVPLEDMGHERMGLIPLIPELMMIAMLKEESSDLALYLKHAEDTMPRLLAVLAEGQATRDFPVDIRYEGPIAQSGIEFKYDPGLPVTYSAFFLLMLGSFFVAMPSSRMWASLLDSSEKQTSIVLGFTGLKAASLMGRDLRRLCQLL
ncbi:MAG TPA: cytochrome c biogenesis protein ResB, partial [Candidatus Obscuribacterales bacterium]